MILVLVAGIFGALFGSFANVPIHRWPRGGTVLAPARSACPACGAQIRWYDNVPVISWLVLRARCRDCGGRIAWHYAAVELVMALLFGAAAAAQGLTWLLPALLAFIWILVVASVIDLEHRIIPNRLTYPAAPALLALLVLTAAMTGEWADLRRAVIAGIGLPAGMLALSELFRLVRGQAGIGMGDIKLAVSIGLVVGYLGGWELIVWFYATAISAVAVAFGLIIAGRAKLASRIPYGPYLAFGAIVAVLFGEPMGEALAGWLGVA